MIEEMENMFILFQLQKVDYNDFKSINLLKAFFGTLKHKFCSQCSDKVFLALKAVNATASYQACAKLLNPVQNTEFRQNFSGPEHGIRNCPKLSKS